MLPTERERLRCGVQTKATSQRCPMADRDESEPTDRCDELLRRLGDLPLSELTPEERKELREATEGMFRPSEREPAEDSDGKPTSA